MLRDITISDLGTISGATVEFGPGLTVLTGETGAGKTMVLSSLRLLCGNRADAGRVREGAERALVEGSLTLTENDEASRAVAEEAGAFADENGDYLLARTVSANGRSRAHLGGRAVPAATLQEFSAPLITIHGQHDQIALLNRAHQREVLDSFDPELHQLAAEYRQAYKNWRQLFKDYRNRQSMAREAAQEADRLRYSIEEIVNIDPKPGEDTELNERIRRLQDADMLRENLSTAIVAIDGALAIGTGDEPGASDLLGQAAQALKLTGDSNLESIAKRIGELTSLLTDISADIGSELGSLPTDPEALNQALSRQHELHGLIRKYAPSIDEVLAWKTKAEEDLAGLDTSPEVMERLKEGVLQAQKTRDELGAKLSAKRAEIGEKLGHAVTQELQGLAMKDVQFQVRLIPLPSKTEGKVGHSEWGSEEVEFELGYGTPKPLAQAASGGELSRVMLALEVLLAKHSSSTIVFDEVDAGVGGRAAVEIGRRLARLATDTQVIVVTHLPQVAAYASTHLHISKAEATRSVVEKLDEEQRIEELSRMLAGLDDTETGRAHASELFAKAQQEVSAFQAKNPRA
ncbi:MAG: DNA repair protein RecN [Corynebacterium sp.]|nr:DNA repair protein RecN [Corynebacterium sp.]